VTTFVVVERRSRFLGASLLGMTRGRKYDQRLR